MELSLVASENYSVISCNMQVEGSAVPSVHPSPLATKNAHITRHNPLEFR